jgi:HEPN domain-containing protein
VTDSARNWIATAEYDLQTAREVLTAGRYIYVVFFCHLAIEKLLKAHVAVETSREPPRTHDLISLVRLSGLRLAQTHLDFIGVINNASTLTRYPADLDTTLRDYSEPIVRDYLERAEEVCEWLRHHPRLPA